MVIGYTQLTIRPTVNCAGNAGDAKIYLNGNELSRFEEDVFLEILQQMTGIRNDGYIDLDASKNE